MGGEVSAGVLIETRSKRSFAAIDNIVPVSTATTYVEEAIQQRISQAVPIWAKKEAEKKLKSYAGEERSDTIIAGVSKAHAAGSKAAVMAVSAVGKMKKGIEQASDAKAGKADDPNQHQ